MDFHPTVFVSKLWNNGLKTALKEEVVDKTTNTFDDVGLGMIDMAINNLLEHFQKKEA